MTMKKRKISNWYNKLIVAKDYKQKKNLMLNDRNPKYELMMNQKKEQKKNSLVIIYDEYY